MTARPRKMSDAQIEAVQERSRQAWNRMVERDEQDLLKSVVDEATAATKAAAQKGRQG